MINVCIADNFPVVHFGMKAYFKDHPEISIVSNVGNFFMVPDALRNKEIDVLIIDLELEGLKSIYEVKSIIRNFPKTKVIVFSSLSEHIYAPNAIKAGCAGYVHKTSKLENLGITIVKVHQGQIILNEEIKRNLALIAKQSVCIENFRTEKSRCCVS
jgi:DNA-binding NarL/FixJ family response regulator